MDNEVVIKVRVDDKSAEKDMARIGQSIKASASKTGQDAGRSLGSEVAKGAGRTLTTGFADSFREVAAHGQAALIGMAIAASPGIGAAISAGIIGGAGGLGILGGVALASRHPMVKAAGTSLGQTLMSGLESDAGSFVQPALRSVDLIENRFQQLRPKIQKIFSNTSGFLEPLVNSSTKAIGSILGGLEKLTSEGGPVMDSIGRSIEIVGASFEKAAGIVAGGSEDAANSTDQMAESLGSLIVVTAGVVRGLTKVASVIVDVNTEINDAATFLPKLFGWMDSGADSASAAAPPIRQVGEAILSAGEAAGEAGQSMATYGEKMADAADKGRGYFDSQTDVAKSIRAAKKALDDNGKGLGTNTEKQLENRDAISKVGRSLVKAYGDYVALNGEGAQASRIASRNRAEFVRLATQFGLTARQANALADDMGLIKDKKIAFYANTHDAAGRIAALKGQIASVKGKTVYINVKKNYDSSSPGDAFAHGGIKGAATGGDRSGMTLVGEHGPELVNLPAGTRVHSNPDTERLLGQGGAGGTLTVRPVYDRSSEQDLIAALFKVLRWEIANSYGGDAQLALGRG